MVSRIWGLWKNEKIKEKKIHRKRPKGRLPGQKNVWKTEVEHSEKFAQWHIITRISGVITL